MEIFQFPLSLMVLILNAAIKTQLVHYSLSPDTFKQLSHLSSSNWSHVAKYFIDFFFTGVWWRAYRLVVSWHGLVIQMSRTKETAMMVIAWSNTGSDLPAIEGINKKCCLKKASNIIYHNTTPANVFSLLALGRRHRCLRTITSRFKH